MGKPWYKDPVVLGLIGGIALLTSWSYGLTGHIPSLW